MSIVREFYANALDAMDDKVMTSDVHIAFGKLGIHLYQRLRDIEHGKYEADLENVDYD